MPRTQFEELQVYQLAESLCDTIWSVAKTWPACERETVGIPLVQAVDSSGANIAAGSGHGSFQHTRRFINIARGSLYETQHWLRRAFKRGLLPAEDVSQLKSLVEQLGPRLNADLTSIGPRDSNLRGRLSQSDSTLPNSNGQRTND